MKKEYKEIERKEPSPEEGLTKEDVRLRIEAGLSNKEKNRIEKSNLEIILKNFLNSFNIILLSIAALFLFFVIYLNATGNKEIADKYFGFSKFTFIIPVILNSMIGTIQEIHSKKVIRKLTIVTESKVFVVRDGKEIQISKEEIVKDDIIHFKAGSQVVCDSILVKGALEADESLLTGESASIKKKEGEMLYSGSLILVGDGYGRVEKISEETYASSLSNQVREIPKKKSKLIESIDRLIKFLAIVLLCMTSIVILTLVYKINRWGSDPTVWSIEQNVTYSLASASTWSRIILTAGAFAIGVIPTGLVLLTSLTLAISIVKLAREKTLIQEFYSLENLSRVDTICLDKTGTLTDGNMEVEKIVSTLKEEEIISLIRKFNFASTDTNPTASCLKEKYGKEEIVNFNYEPFSSQKKSSSLQLEDGEILTLGAPEYLLRKEDPYFSSAVKEAKNGNRVLAFLSGEKVLALFVLKDRIRPSCKETLSYFYKNHLDIKIISGDNPFTIQKIAEKCSVRNAEKVISMENVSIEEIPSLVEEYTIFARVSPEQKKAIVLALQKKGRNVAMTGDGVNDILALRQANASISFCNATDAAKACSDLILLDNDFSHLKEVVSQGRRVVNNIERSATLFLMKTVCFILLSLLLIPFKRGQMWFSVENLYMMQFSVITIGGFLLSLESSEEPIRGTFKENVLYKAFLSGIFMAISSLLPILFYEIPMNMGQTPLLSIYDVSSMISLLTTLSGFIVMFNMCRKMNRYRLIVFLVSLLSGILSGLFSPTSFIGGKVTTFSMFHSNDGNFFHSQFFREIFQPWNCPSVVSLVKNPTAWILYFSFLVFGSVLYTLMLNWMKKKKTSEKKSKRSAR